MKKLLKLIIGNKKTKRWVLLIIIGMLLTCYQFAKIIAADRLELMELGKIGILFIIGFTCFILGIVFLQRRILELAVNPEMMKNKNPINSKGPNVVVIGGGNGLNTVLKGLKKYTSNITAIVTVSSYGKAQTESRKKLELLPIDDIKDSIVSLSNDEEMMASLLDTELNNRSLKGLTFGDIFFTTMKEKFGNFSESVEKSKNVLNIVGRVLPVTLDEMQICAELTDGTIIEERDKIKDIVYDKVGKIERVFITPSNCVPAPGVLEAIKNADAIIIGPGSLYTNVIPNLLVKNVSKTIKESKAIKIYVSNIMTEPGQTDNYTLSEHIKAILDHAGKDVVDYCIYDSGEIIPEFIKIYNRRGQDVVEQDIQKSKELGVKLLEKNLSQIVGDNIRHNTEAVAESVIELICDDLRFKDEQNDPKYVMLHTKLKEEKKIHKEQKRIEKKKSKKQESSNDTKVENKKNASKFSNKYKDRIKSIKESDFKIEQKRRMQNEAKEKEEFLKQINKK